MKIQINHARVIDPSQRIDQVMSVFIQDGKMAGLGQAPTGFVADEQWDVSGHWVFPGLIDMQARLGEPGKNYAGNIASETKAAVSGGITGLLCPPDTSPVTDSQAVAELIQRRARQAATAFVMPIGALTQGLSGERLTNMHSLKQGGCVALSQANQPIQNPLILKNALDYAASHNLLIMLRSEDQQLRNNGVAHAGAVSTRLGLPGITASAETAALARDLILVEESGVRAHFSQLSCARSVEMIQQAKQRGLPVTCDVAAHQLHLTEMDVLEFNSLFHVSPPLRSHYDREALRNGLKTGVIDAIVSDHTPLGRDDKQLPFGESTPGISALETLLALTLRLVDEKVLTLTQALQHVTEHPARILGLPSGTLAKGSSADLIIFNPEKHWCLSADQILSAGKNTPFVGWEFSGKVVRTLFQGRTVFQL
jgi:dihydroorotase